MLTIDKISAINKTDTYTKGYERPVAKDKDIIDIGTTQEKVGKLMASLMKINSYMDFIDTIGNIVSVIDDGSYKNELYNYQPMMVNNLTDVQISYLMSFIKKNKNEKDKVTMKIIDFIKWLLDIDENL